MAPTKEWNHTSQIPLSYSQRELLRPRFGEEARHLDSLLADFDGPALEKLMKISPDLARETWNGLEARREGDAPLKPAFLSYGGTAFKSMDPASLSGESLDFAHNHIRILSGLYGLLRPLDGVPFYRLEMNTALNVPGEGRLKAFWKKRLAPALREEEALVREEAPVINLASAEYAGAVDRKVLGRPVITVSFKEKSDGGLRTVGMYAKQARGRMVREIIEGRITEAEDIRGICFEGYGFDFGCSGPDQWVFTRPAQALALILR